ncbi:hypothetical protein [Desulforamulus aeronauticus]|uniref:Uncharacterized protein n=1 Tax=Desulforamulus aeronauticus DSM 10349 TaxID=1121421 RepID=A0A1M6SN74_9FIRM|nr:hypothetical protein [Desulforamulus aeronauticus]SHK46155.1 hypothetical protein SAMN02745123_01919 [Desulforamulus aeronauticus DSM 10349]
MVGERGSGSNAFSLFLILVLLYFAQRGVSVNAYSESSKAQDIPEQPETPTEGKLAVGLSNGEVTEYIPDSVVYFEENDLEPVVPIEQLEFEQTMADPAELTEEEWVAAEEVEEIKEIFEESSEEIELEEASEKEPIVDVFFQVPEENLLDSIEETQNEFIAPDEVTEEPLGWSSSEEEFIQDEQEEQPFMETPSTQITAEPLLGGQDHLFLKPLINDIKTQKVKHAGPKISINFGR